jgi:hypothetical protein
MPRFIDSLSTLEKPQKADDLVIILRRILTNHNMTISQDTAVIFNDFNDEEKEPEWISSEEDALSRILAWPALGGTSYNFAGQKLSIFLYGSTKHYVDVLATSIMATEYLADPKIKSAYDALVSDLHLRLGAVRTISDYELLSPNSLWREELYRVRAGRLEGKYAIDLR